MKNTFRILFVLLAVAACTPESRNSGKPQSVPAKPAAPTPEPDATPTPTPEATPEPTPTPTPEPLKPNYEIIMIDPRYPKYPFYTEIDPSNQQGIAQFESLIVNGKIPTDEEGDPVMPIMMGKVVKMKPTTLHPWNFKLDPKTISFTDFALEDCDGPLDRVALNIDQWIATIKVYCPWQTRKYVVHIRKGYYIFYERQKK